MVVLYHQVLLSAEKDSQNLLQISYLNGDMLGFWSELLYYSSIVIGFDREITFGPYQCLHASGSDS